MEGYGLDWLMVIESGLTSILTSLKAFFQVWWWMPVVLGAPRGAEIGGSSLVRIQLGLYSEPLSHKANKNHKSASWPLQEAEHWRGNEEVYILSKAVSAFANGAMTLIPGKRVRKK